MLRIIRLALAVLVVASFSFSASAAKVRLSRSPVVIDGILYAEAAELARVLGASCFYNRKEESLSIVRGLSPIELLTLRAGSKEVLSNLRVVEIDREIWLDQGKIAAPVNVIAEVFGFQMTFTDDLLLLSRELEFYEIPLEPQPKWTAVILSEQRIYFHLGDWLYANFPCSTGIGKHGKDWKKYKDAYWVIKKEGANARSIEPGKYNEPTPFKLYLAESLGGAYCKKAIHGFRSVPPYPASHGCIRMVINDAKGINSWAELAMPVQVQLRKEELYSWRGLIPSTASEQGGRLIHRGNVP